MSLEIAIAHLRKYGKEEAVQEFTVSSATVELAAKAVGTEPGRIAKSLTYQFEDTGLMIVAAGDVRVQNRLFKATFGMKARMLPPEEVPEKTNHAVGGVCPFGVPEALPVYLDESLKAYDIIYPACGSANSCVKLTPEELYEIAGAKGWVRVTE